MQEIEESFGYAFQYVPCWSALVRYNGVEVFARQADVPYISASIIKVFLLEMVTDTIETQGTADWSDMLRKEPRHNAPWSGILNAIDYDNISVQMACNLMFNISDNTATNLIIEALGGIERVNLYLERKYGSKVRLYKYVGEDAYRRRLVESFPPEPGFPTQYGLGVTDIYSWVTSMEKLVARVPLLVARQQVDSMFSRVSGFEVFHKTGNADSVYHDGGIMRDKLGNELEIYVLTDGAPQQAHKAMGTAFDEVFAYYQRRGFGIVE